jgi:ADP-heptose:LPS heptosyltransferase
MKKELPVILFPIGTDGKHKKLSDKKMKELARHIAKHYPKELKKCPFCGGEARLVVFGNRRAR